MDRPCRDGADRAERQNGRLTSSSSWPPSSFSPSCHPLPHPRVPRLDRSCRDCTGRVRRVSRRKYTLQYRNGAGTLHLGSRAAPRAPAECWNFHRRLKKVQMRGGARQAGRREGSRCEAASAAAPRGVDLTQPSPRGCAPQLERPRTLTGAASSPQCASRQTKQMGPYRRPAKSLRAWRRVCDARDGGRIPG